MLGKTLLVMRHGKSDWDADAARDFDRPLAGRGKKDVARMGEWLQHEHLIPDRLLSSPARRADKTARRVAQALGLTVVVYEPDIYEASRNQLLDVLGRHTEEVQVLMLVGHNPGLDELVEYLAADEVPHTADGKLMTTAAVAILDFDNEWNLKAGSGRLRQIMRPKALPV